MGHVLICECPSINPPTPLAPLFPHLLDQATRHNRQLGSLSEKMDRIKQHRVLGRDNVGRINKSEEGKNNNAKQRDGYGPGLLFFLN